MKEILEEWRDISGYEGLYQVSNTGKIKGLKRIVKCVSKVDPKKEWYKSYKETIHNHN